MKSPVYSSPAHYSPPRPVRTATPARRTTRDTLVASYRVDPSGQVTKVPTAAKAPCQCGGDQVQPEPDMADLAARVGRLEQAIAILVQGDDPAPAKQAAPATDRAWQPVRDARAVTQDKLQARERQQRAAVAQQVRSMSAAFRRHYGIGGR